LFDFFVIDKGGVISF